MAVTIALPMSPRLLAAGVAVLTAGCAVIAFGVVAYPLDDGDLRVVLTQLQRTAGLRRTFGRCAGESPQAEDLPGLP